MKIKTDFITNSSSTAFITFIPKRFFLDNNDIKEIYKEFEKDLKDNEKLTDELLFKEIPECIEIIKNGDDLWTYGDDGCNKTIWDIILEICEENNFIMCQVPISSEGFNTIQGVEERVIEQIIINNIDILSIFNAIQRGGINVTTKNS